MEFKRFCDLFIEGVNDRLRKEFNDPPSLTLSEKRGRSLYTTWEHNAENFNNEVDVKLRGYTYADTYFN